MTAFISGKTVHDILNLQRESCEQEILRLRVCHRLVSLAERIAKAHRDNDTDKVTILTRNYKRAQRDQRKLTRKLASIDRQIYRLINPESTDSIRVMSLFLASNDEFEAFIAEVNDAFDGATARTNEADATSPKSPM